MANQLRPQQQRAAVEAMGVCLRSLEVVRREVERDQRVKLPQSLGQLSTDIEVFRQTIQHVSKGLRLESSFRTAMVALAREVVSSNAALSAALGPGDVVRADTQGSQSLAVAVALVEYFGTTFLYLLACAAGSLDPSSREDSNFTYKILATSCIILDSGSRVLGATVDCASQALWGHNKAFRQLVDTLVAMGEVPAIKLLRATTCSPDAIMTCLRRLLPKKMDRLQGTMHSSGGSCSTVAEILASRLPLFAPEQAAIAEDRDLLAGIAARAETDLDRLRLICEDEDTGRLRSADAQTYREARVALDLLTLDLVCGTTGALTCWKPGCTDRILAVANLFVRLRPPQALVDSGQDGRSAALANAISGLHRVSQPGTDSPAREMAFGDMVRCIGMASAAMIELLQAADGTAHLPQAAEGMQLLMGRIIQRISMLPMPSADGEISSRGGDVATWAAQYQALEGMLRLAALMPARLPVDCPAPPDDGRPPAAETILSMLAPLFFVVDTRGRGAPSSDHELWNSIAGLVNSATKFALRLARPEREAASAPEKLNCLDRMVVRAAKANEMAGPMKEKGLPTSQWQGMALAVWAAVAAANKSYPPSCVPASYVLLSSFMAMPWACDLALATPAGRSTVLRVYEGMLEGGGGSKHGGMHAAALWDSLKKMMGAETSAPAVGLARCGVLTRLLRWAADKCSPLHPEGPPADRPLFIEKLAIIFRLTLEATCASKHEVNQSLRDASEGGTFLTPEIYDQLRLERIEPLVLELEAKAAAEEGDTAKQAQLAVDAAEALATRPCAHACCTTIVGAREADTHRGKRCAGCNLVRYCCKACQSTDWRAHKAACREVARRRGGGSA